MPRSGTVETGFGYSYLYLYRSICDSPPEFLTVRQIQASDANEDAEGSAFPSAFFRIPTRTNQWYADEDAEGLPFCVATN